MKLPSLTSRKRLPYGSSLQPGWDLSLLVWVFFALLASNTFLFIFYTASPYVRSDVWRHLEDIIIPFLEHTEGLSILWSNHHPSPLLHTLHIINIKYFGFRLDYDAYLGYFFQVITTLLILKIIISTAGENRKIGIVSGLFLLLIISIELGFNTLDQYTWPLLTTVQYLYFFGIVVFLTVDRCIQRESRRAYLAVAVAALVLMLANTSYGTIFLMSTIAVLMLVYALDRRAAYLRSALIIFAVWVTYYSILVYIIPSGPYRPSSSLTPALLRLLEQPLVVLTQFSLGLSAGLIDIVSIKRGFTGSEQLLVFVALLLTLLLVLIFITYLARGLYRVSMTPLLLMFMPVIFAASALINRASIIRGDEWGLTVTRYAPTFKFSIIGMIWAVWLIANALPLTRNRPIRGAGRTVAAVLVFLILIVQGVQIVTGWRQVPGLQRKNDNDALAVYLAGTTPENSVTLPFTVRGFIAPARKLRDAQAYLERNQLNVFSSKFPRGPILEQYVESRRQFKAAATSMTVGMENGKYRRILAGEDEIDASWTAGPTGIIINSHSTMPVCLRVRAQAGQRLTNGVSLTFRSTSIHTQSIDLFQGKQNLYFCIENGEELELVTVKPFSILEFELRV